MDDLHHEQEFIFQVEQCTAALRKLKIEPDDHGRQSRAALAERFLQLSPLITAHNLDGVRRIVDCVGQCLSRERELPAQIQQLERNSLSLAAEWLDELMRLYANRLPEPRGLVNNLLYSFVLLQHAEAAGSMEPACPSDLFAGDPGVTSEAWSFCARDIDPFTEDPGFGHLYDLLQRTLNHVACLGVCSGSDPFAKDPEACDSGSVDMFERDPPLPLTETDSGREQY